MSVADGNREVSGSDRSATTVEWAVPADETPAGRCPYCDRPFRRERFYHLHIGVAHAADCTEAEATAYDEAHDDETDDLFVYHLKVVAGLVVLFFSTTYTYAFLLA